MPASTRSVCAPGAAQQPCSQEHAVQRRVRPDVATVIAAGAWTPQVVRKIDAGEAAEPVHLGIQPRKGHLLEIPESLVPPVVKHGLMEIGYAKVSKAA